MKRFSWTHEGTRLKLDDEGPWLLWEDHVKDQAVYIVALSRSLQLLKDIGVEHGSYSGRVFGEIRQMLGDDFNMGLVRRAEEVIGSNGI